MAEEGEELDELAEALAAEAAAGEEDGEFAEDLAEDLPMTEYEGYDELSPTGLDPNCLSFCGVTIGEFAVIFVNFEESCPCRHPPAEIHDFPDTWNVRTLIL